MSRDTHARSRVTRMHAIHARAPKNSAVHEVHAVHNTQHNTTQHNRVDNTNTVLPNWHFSTGLPYWQFLQYKWNRITRIT